LRHFGIGQVETISASELAKVDWTDAAQASRLPAAKRMFEDCSFELGGILYEASAKPVTGKATAEQAATNKVRDEAGSR